MKTYLKHILAGLGLCLGLAACQNEQNHTSAEELRADSHMIRFDFTVLDPQTRATESGDYYDPLNENVINNMYAFLYDVDGVQMGIYSTAAGNLVLTPNASTAVNPKNGGGAGSAVRGSAVLYAPKQSSSTLQGRSFRLYVLANYHGDVNLLRDATLDELKVYTQTTASMAQTTVQKQPDFLMDGSMPTGTLNWTTSNVYNISTTQRGLTLKLTRAAAKIRVRINAINVNDEGVRFEMIGLPTIALVRGQKETGLLAEGDKVTTVGNVNTNFQPMNLHTYDGQRFYARDVPFYSYETDWTTHENRRTYLIIKLMLKRAGTNNEPFASYYNVPVNYLLPKEGMANEEKAGVTKLQRNHLYDIVCNINELGEAESGQPITFLQPHIAVDDWNKPEAIDGSISKAHYLFVKEKRPIMANVNTIEIPYVSDLPLALEPGNLQVKTKFVGYDNLGNEQVTTGTNQNGEIKITTFERDGHKYIRVESPIPTNYVPLTITFQAQHVQVQGETANPLQDEVVVTQYPPIYVTAEKSKGIQQYWYSTFTGYGNGPTGRGDQANGLLFKVTTLVPRAGQIVGDPTLGTDRTDRGVEADNITSPQFIIASQWAIGPQLEQYKQSGSNIGWIEQGTYKLQQYTGIVDKYVNGRTYYRYRDFYDAASRAYNYWEDDYGPAGTRTLQGDATGWSGRLRRTTTVNFNPTYKGRWRIPTSAELELVASIQLDPKSAVKNLLWGDYYWVARTGYQVLMREVVNGKIQPVRDQVAAGTLVSVRPVFDTYNK